MFGSETHCWSKSLATVIYDLYHHLEMKHISFEHNSPVKFRNPFLVKKVSKGYIGHIPSFGREAHKF